jgi:type III secretion protein D
METLSMKALRVLTGVHAGARIALVTGVHRISAEPDADICISDWTVAPLALTLGEDGVARLDAGAGEAVLLADFVAVPYGDVAFCVGPDDAVWPGDLALLAGLWNTAPLVQEDAAAQPAADAPQDKRRLSSRAAAMALVGTVAIGGLATAGALLTGTQTSEAANVKVDNGALASQLAAALHQAGLAGLHVEPRERSLSVTGIVTNATEAARARRIAEALAPGKVRRDYDVAQQDVDEIQQSLSGTGASVAYAGNGVFRISGNVPSLTMFRERMASVRADLDRNVKGLDVQVSETHLPAQNIEYAEAIAAGGLRYIETPDGTKHLLGNDPNETHANN